MKIPQIIHQIWSEKREPLPECFRILGDTWKRDYPDWQHILWNDNTMKEFVSLHYPQYLNIYNSFPYDVQRWDAVRYLILEKMGGMYVDTDYESIMPMDEILFGKTCCFAEEPELHRKSVNKSFAFNNALMACIPNHPFIRKVIETVYSEEMLSFPSEPKNKCVFTTTGPWMLMTQYEHLKEKERQEIFLIPYRYVTPFDIYQAQYVRMGVENEELEACLEEAYAVHYFFSGWY